MRRRSTPEDFWSHVEIGDDGDCWLWDGYVEPDGYGLLSFAMLENRFPIRAHRIAWALTKGNGVLPVGRDLHHVCRNKRCVNPSHLELLTDSDHRQLHGAEARAKKKPCEIHGLLRNKWGACPKCKSAYISKWRRERRKKLRDLPCC